MSDFAGTINEQVVRGERRTPELELGVVGWPGEDTVCDIGSADNDGRTLVRVTLHRGGGPGDEPKPGEAAGYRVSVRVTGPLFYVPPKGSEVLVAFPSGFGMAPGAGVLLCTTGATPAEQFSETQAKLDVGADSGLFLKGKSVKLGMYNPDDPTDVEDFVSLSPDGGIQAINRNGFGVHIDLDAVTIFAPDENGDAKSVLRVTKDEIMLANKDSGGALSTLTLKQQEVCSAGLVFNSCTPGANLGALATAATPAVIGVGTAATLTAWLGAFTAWMATVSTFCSAPTPGAPPLAGSATVNVQP